MSRRTISQRIQTAWRTLRVKGVRAFLQKLADARIAHVHRPLDDFAFVLPESVGVPVNRDGVKRDTINWVVPPFSAGAGGHTTIFRLVHLLEQQGFDCRIVVLGGLSHGSPQHYRDLIRTSFFPLKADVFVDIENAPASYVSVATGWESAYAIRGLRSTVHRCYFVQDFEPWFYAVGSEHCLAEATYRFGFRGITAGSWLANKLRDEYGMQTEPIGFSCDKSIYFVRPKISSSRRKVFFYARPSTERRAFELGLLTLAQLCKRMPDVTCVLAGGDLSNYDIPFDHVSHGVVSVSRLSELFSECDAALVLSLTNVSLLPLELMACGTLVVSNSGPFVQWLLNDSNSFLAEPTVPSLVDALCLALTDTKKADTVRKEGLRLAAASSWTDEAARMGEVFRSLETA